MKYILLLFLFVFIFFGFGKSVNAGKEFQNSVSLASEKKLVIGKNDINTKGKEAILKKRKDALANVLFRIISRLNSFEEKIKLNLQIEEEKKNEILAEVDGRLLELKEIQEQLDTVLTVEELQILRTSIQESLPKERALFRLGGQEGIETRFVAMIKRLEKIEKQFNTVATNLQSKGIQDKTFSSLLQEYHDLLIDLKVKESNIRQNFQKEKGKPVFEETRKISLLLRESHQKTTEIFQYLKKLSSKQRNSGTTEK